MNQRYHALDNLRGIIMWLGVILHVSCNHMVGESIIPWRDSETGIFADLIVIFIHTFRMPTFFILAGFFAAFLLFKDGPNTMLANRMKRLAIPFALFWPILLLLSAPLILMFLNKMETGVATVDSSVKPDLFTSKSLTTMHLWFLYYLIYFCLSAVFVNKVINNLPTNTKEKALSVFTLLAKSWWGIIVLTLPLTLIGGFYKLGFLTPDTTLIPNPLNFIHHGLYFLFGWLLFYKKDEIFSHYQQYCWHYLASGYFLYFIVMVEFGMVQQGKLTSNNARYIIAATYNSIGWIWSMALIGLFLRYVNQHSRWLRYLADSSYWVYLVHMLPIIGFGLVIYDAPLTLIPKMVVNIVATSIICLITYHLFVRSTRIGLLLNGRRKSKSQNKNTFDKTATP